MKKIYLIIILLFLLIRGEQKQKIRDINLASFSGNITLNLKHGIWKNFQGSPVYQNITLDLVCKQSECQPEVFAYAPRFERKREYLGTIKKLNIDNAWHLEIDIDFQGFFPENPEAKGKYYISIIPYNNSFLADYSGKVNGHYLESNNVDIDIKPWPQLITNYQNNTDLASLNISKFILDPDKLKLKNYQINRNVNYLTINNHQLLLDIYQRKTEQPSPTIIYIHGGGWFTGNKPSLNAFWQYLVMGFSVVNIEYRLADTAPAPAAVEDCLCALFWVNKNAKKYNFDLNKIVVTGASAGGHLALMTGMSSFPKNLTKNCPFPLDKNFKVAAIINWFGPTDVEELITGKNSREYAINWLNGVVNKKQIAALVSPINYVNKNVPPILSIHGSEDITVPYQQAVKLHDDLTTIGVTNDLLRLPGRHHGDFSQAEIRQIYGYIENFLQRNQILD